MHSEIKYLKKEQQRKGLEQALQGVMVEDIQMSLHNLLLHFHLLNKVFYKFLFTSIEFNWNIETNV